LSQNNFTSRWFGDESGYLEWLIASSMSKQDEFIPDVSGTELPDLNVARREAARAAGEMIDDAQ
jgi:hypothetical protein